jgi:hypothetical protein
MPEVVKKCVVLEAIGKAGKRPALVPYLKNSIMGLGHLDRNSKHPG